MKNGTQFTGLRNNVYDICISLKKYSQPNNIFFVLSNTGNIECGPGRYKCLNDSDTCIDMVDVCNSYFDCPGGSDERSCDGYIYFSFVNIFPKNWTCYSF